MFKFLGKLLDSNDKEITRLAKTVESINACEAGVKSLTDGDFAKKTAEYKARLEHGMVLDDILPEAFALVREAAWRTIGQRHFDVQLIAAITLHNGKVAEQKTGELNLK